MSVTDANPPHPTFVDDYVLREVDGAFRMVRKKVALVDNDKPLYTLSFLI